MESNRQSWSALTWLVIAGVVTLFSNGRWILPPATWLAPIGWIMFLERSRRVSGTALGLLLFILVTLVMWQGLIPAPGVIYYIIAATYALVYFVPFVLNALFSRRFSGFRSTLVFPIAWVSVEFLFFRYLTPYGSWFSLAYTQTDYLPLMQLASVTGTAGISFLMCWFASISVWVSKRHVTSPARRSGLVTYGSVILAVLVFGQVRLLSSDTDTATIRAAALVPSGVLTEALENALAPARRGEDVSSSELDTMAAIAFRLNDDLFARSRREARAGARLVAWSETAGRIFKEDEPDFLQMAGRVALEEDIYLLLGYGVYDTTSVPPFENKVTAVGPDGVVDWEYQKAHPIVGAESGFIRRGDGIIDVLETEFGRIGAVICHDLDFPRHLRTASLKDIGLIVGPSADWSDILTIHANMAGVRAIEGGFSLLRPTSGGRSLAIDNRGRILASVDNSENSMIAMLGATPSTTIYRLVGDLFAWLCVAGLVVILATSVFRYPSQPGPVVSDSETLLR